MCVRCAAKPGGSIINVRPQQTFNMKPHRATLILVMGILSLVICEPLGIVVWVMQVIL